MSYEDEARRLLQIAEELGSACRRAPRDLSRAERGVLMRLCESEGGVCPSELADSLGYSRARVTRVIDSLERRGEVCRTQDPSDRRRVIVTVSDETRAAMRGTCDGEVRAAAGALERLGEHDARELVRIFERLQELAGCGGEGCGSGSALRTAC